MRKLIVCNIMSLDGKYTGPGDNIMVMPMDPAFDAYNLERIRAADTTVLSGTSYEQFQDYWPAVQHTPEASATNRELSRLYDPIRKVVVSDRFAVNPPQGPWLDSATFVIRDEAVQAVANLKKEPGGEILIFASRRLWNHLLAAGLVDELHFVVGSVIVGEDGVPAFEAGTRLRALSAQPMEGSGNILVRYEPIDN
jgi:dihydrofolate reductase